MKCLGRFMILPECDLWSYLCQTKKPIVLYGMGNGADRILNELERLGVKASGVFASDDFVRGQNFRGYTVEKYSDLEQRLGEMIILVAFGTQRREVIDNILSLSQKQELYSVDVPVFGEGVFNLDFAKANIEKIEKVYSMLCDEKSKKVYEDIINFKLSGKIQYLFDCQTEPKEAYDNVLRLGSDEVYMDLGAFTGDTVEEFIRNVGTYRRIYAVEPDKRSFKRLCENTSGLLNIELFNNGISDKNETLLFAMKGGRNSNAAAKGKEVEALSVDSLLGGKEVSYIKIDVEGCESKAISGAKNTITEYKPKMLVSAYHRAEDIFSLPLEVAQIRKDYKLAIRHYEYIPAWDTNFYFV